MPCPRCYRDVGLRSRQAGLTRSSAVLKIATAGGLPAAAGEHAGPQRLISSAKPGMTTVPMSWLNTAVIVLAGAALVLESGVATVSDRLCATGQILAVLHGGGAGRSRWRG